MHNASEAALAAPDVGERLEGTLLGTALGDALGLPAEGMSARAIARRFGAIDRFRLLGARGFVSDDTEQSALVAQSLVRHPDDVQACVDDFRHALLGWFLRLPFGIGLATLRSCLRIAAGLRPTGVRSAGNGAAMRAPIVGVFLRDEAGRRRELAAALARVTHLDARAVDGAVFAAEVAAQLSLGRPREEAVARSRDVVSPGSLRDAIDRASVLADGDTPVADAATELRTTGFVVHTVPFVTFGLLRHGGQPMAALSTAIAAGGDTDTIAAVLGGWLGAAHGTAWLPAALVGAIHDGPFGPSHLRALAAALARVRAGESVRAPAYSPATALLRNLLLYPVILGHGFRRLLPPWGP